MSRREPITPETRAAVLAAIQAGGKCRQIAREHGVSPGYVSKLAKQVPGDAFDRERTQPAAAARKFDAKAAREAAIEALYTDFERFRQRAWSPYTQLVGSGPSAELVTLKLPPLRDAQSAMVAAAVCLDKALALEARDNTGGAEAGKTMVNDLFGALGMVHHRIVAEEKVIDARTGREISDDAGIAAKVDEVHQAQHDAGGR